MYSISCIVPLCETRESPFDHSIKEFYPYNSYRCQEQIAYVNCTGGGTRPDQTAFSAGAYTQLRDKMPCAEIVIWPHKTILGLASMNYIGYIYILA